MSIVRVAPASVLRGVVRVPPDKSITHRALLLGSLSVSGGRPLRGLEHALEVASAQVKSCLLLAGLYAEGETWVREPAPSRDHTERMLEAAGVPLLRSNGAVGVSGPVEGLSLPDIEVP